MSVKSSTLGKLTSRCKSSGPLVCLIKKSQIVKLCTSNVHTVHIGVNCKTS